MSYYDRVLPLIKAKGWSKSEFERRIGKSTGTLNAWRTGNASPEKYLPKVAEVLNTTEAYLRSETDDPRPDDQQELDDLEWAMLDGAKKLTDEQKRIIIELIKNMGN